MSVSLKIEKYSHGCRVTGFDVDSLHKTTRFLESLSLKEPQRVQNRMTMVLKKKYYGMTENKRELFIHRNSLPEYVNHLSESGYPTAKIVYNQIPLPPAANADYLIDDKYQLRDYQIPIVGELADDTYSRRLDLQTGKGKTFTTLAAVARMGCRAVVMIPPKYFGIWKTALDETYGDSAKFRLVSGSGELKQLILDGLDGNIHEEVLIVSCVSYRGYIEAYETYGENIESSGYAVAPPRFHEAVGAGVQINDEFQEDPGLYFRIDVYSNVKKMIYLSATPYTGNAYVTRMIDVMTPAETRCTLPEWDRYIDVVWLLYSDPTVQAKDYLTPFKNTYNHARYETKLLEKKKRLEFYLAYVRRMVEGLYVRDRQVGQKALVLCSTVKFIHVLTDFLKQQFPDLSIGFHVAGCDYKKLVTYDIIVSTPKSCGTGVDIPNLRETFLCVATGSEKDAVQIMGRTRPLKGWPEHTPRLNVLVCNNIPQHLRYMDGNKEVFSKKARYQRMARL
ncbi:hypothetical protein D3C84_45300 [compost metagenome]